jgi:hypothetical protein
MIRKQVVDKFRIPSLTESRGSFQPEQEILPARSGSPPGSHDTSDRLDLFAGTG